MDLTLFYITVVLCNHIVSEFVLSHRKRRWRNVFFLHLYHRCPCGGISIQSHLPRYSALLARSSACACFCDPLQCMIPFHLWQRDTVTASGRVGRRIDSAFQTGRGLKSNKKLLITTIFLNLSNFPYKPIIGGAIQVMLLADSCYSRSGTEIE